MFSLIITIISIALVAVLALATLYYGGDAFNRGSAEAQAAKLLNQSQQLLGAADLFYVDYKRYPADVAELLNGPNGEHYLKHAPVALEGHGSVSEAWAASTWSMPQPYVPVFQVEVASTDACTLYNKRASLQAETTPSAVDPALMSQCYGGADGYTVVVQRKVGQLQEVLNASAAWLNAYPSIFPGGGFYPLYKAAQGAGPVTVNFGMTTPIPGFRFTAAWLADAAGNAQVACGSGSSTSWTCTTTAQYPNVMLGVTWDGSGGGNQHTDVTAQVGSHITSFHVMTIN